MRNDVYKCVSEYQKMSTRILIIGNTSESFHIGAIFVRTAQSLNLDLAFNDISWNTYAPSMKYKWGRGLFKLFGKRPLEWWSFNHNCVRSIKTFCPQVILVTGIFPLIHEVFQASYKVGATIVNYLTDNPWSAQNYCYPFIVTLRKYDIIFSTKKTIIPDLLEFGVKKSHFLPFAFDPLFHQEVCEESGKFSRKIADVCLIGGADKQRQDFVLAFIRNFNGQLGLYGGDWHKNKYLQQFYQGIVLGEDYFRVVRNCKINIGLVRRANRDGHSMRSYEIPACGGVGIYEDTSEHRDLFQGYPEYGFFTSPEDLADKCNWLLEHPVEREQMRQLGIELIVTEANTYGARLKTILELVGN